MPLETDPPLYKVRVNYYYYGEEATTDYINNKLTPREVFYIAQELNCVNGGAEIIRAIEAKYGRTIPDRSICE